MEIDEQVIFAILKFIHSQKSSFSLKDVISYLKKFKINANPKDIEMFLESITYLVTFEDNTYCSKEIVFEDVCFSIFPTQKEINEGYLIIGHRTLPFTNPTYLPSELTFSVNKKNIPKTIKSIPNIELHKHYALFGEDKMQQVIEMDAANDGENSENILDPDLYSTKVTVLDMKSFYKKYNFKYGDRIICYTQDWLSGKINIAPYSFIKESSSSISEITQLKKIWINLFEKNLATIIKDFGALEDINEQLFNAFMLDLKHLKNSFYISIEEALEQSSTFEIQPFGIESRIGFKGQHLIGIRNWDDPFVLVPLLRVDIETYGISKCIMLNLDKNIIIAYLKDAIFNNESDIKNIAKKIIPDFISVDKQDYENVLVQLKSEITTLKTKYNKFKDYPVANIRHGVLELFTKIIYLVHEIRLSTIDPATMQQQPLVIIMNLVDHISRILCIYLVNPFVSDDELVSMENSLEGMKMSYEENSVIIMNELKARRNNLTLSFGNAKNKNESKK